MKRPPVLITVSVALALTLVALAAAACGGPPEDAAAGSGVAVTTIPTLANTSSSAEPTLTTAAVSGTQATGGHTSITHTTASGPTTATGGASTDTSGGGTPPTQPAGVTLSEPPTGSTMSGPPKPPSTLVVVKPTNVSLLPVLAWNVYQETYPGLYWDGSWTQRYNLSVSGGGYKSTDSGGRVSMTFTGRRAALISAVSPSYGVIRLRLDYQTVGAIDLYRAQTKHQTVIWTSDLLADGTHVLSIEPTGTRNPSSGGYGWMFDAVKIVGTLHEEFTQD